MKTFRPTPSLTWLSALALLAATPSLAQEVVQPLPGTTDADALAADMRRLATNPRDVDALVDAAHLSLRLGDMRAAAALLARAENVDPHNARVKAGQASILVQSERPGEALRYFAQAETLGLDPAAFAADRALAYDLTGQQDRAQRDYRTALRGHPDDEETIRRYALSLGISGQRERALALLDPLVRRSDRGAWRSQAFILAMTGDVGGASRIAATMIPGGAAGLSAFFERLPTLSAIDRAFAVHFGEVRPTPERLADARLAPPLAPLPHDGSTATMVASAPPPPPPRRDRRPREAPRTEIAVAPSIAADAGARVASSARPGATATPAAEPAKAPPPPAPVRIASVPPSAPPPSATTPSAPSPGAPQTTPAPVAAPPVAGAPPFTQPAPVRTASRMSEDSILARIVAGLSIPASELGVAEPERAAPAEAQRTEPDPAIAEADRLADQKRATARALADKRAADRKAVADKKALAEKKAAAAAKVLADREAAEAKKLVRANPERIWVQVAGGAYEGDLPKAYAAVKAKAPAVFGSRGGYTTPLRATNRVLAGPFKTESEARDFVNDLRKEGVSAFTFTSDAGQPVRKLGAKGGSARDDDEPAVPPAKAKKASRRR